MTLFELAGLVGLVLPILISLLKRADWSTYVKSWFAFVTAIVASVITEAAVGPDLWNLDPAGIFGALGVILPASQALYLTIMKDTVFDEVLENLPL